MKRIRQGLMAIGLAGLLGSQTGCFDLSTFLVGGNPPPTSSVPRDPPVQKYTPERALQLCLTYAESLEKEDKFEDAIAQYQRALQMEPRNLHAARRIAVLCDYCERFDEAEAQYKKLAEVRSRDSDLFNDWGRHYYLRNRWDESENKLRRALELNKKNQRARCNLAMALAQQGLYEDAFNTFREAGLGEAEANVNMAFILWTQDPPRIEQARQACRWALKADPQCSKAKDLLAQLDPNQRPLPKQPPAKPAERAATNPQRPRTPPAMPFDPSGQPAVSSQTDASQPIYRSPNGIAWVPVNPRSAAATANQVDGARQ